MIFLIISYNIVVVDIVLETLEALAPANFKGLNIIIAVLTRI